MRRSALKRGGRGYSTRKACIACHASRDIVGPLSYRGICHSCAVVHMVANSLGMTHLHYTDESLNGLIHGSYTGPVIKAA